VSEGECVQEVRDEKKLYVTFSLYFLSLIFSKKS